MTDQFKTVTTIGFIFGRHLKQIWAVVFGNNGDKRAGFLHKTDFTQRDFTAADYNNATAFEVVK